MTENSLNNEEFGESSNQYDNEMNDIIPGLRTN